jgi:uncharacterized protein (TIGR00299 family) protein
MKRASSSPDIAARRGELALHFDGVAGAAGDMTIGALLAVGVPKPVIEQALEEVGLGLPEGRLKVTQVVKGGILAVDVKVRGGHEHGHSHGHASGAGHPHRSFREIAERIENSGLDSGVKRRALAIFTRLAVAEAKLHGTSPEEVVFHEVGAIDAIADVVGAAAGIDWLRPVRISAGTVVVGDGAVSTQHGVLPVPSPAAMEILCGAGAPVCGGGVARELCTPTGAAVLAACAQEWGTMPEWIPVAVGYGAGDMDLPDRPNVLRLSVGVPKQKIETDAIYRLEANVDDMNPEFCESAAEAVRAAGAIEVWWSSIVMKKSRPALLFCALVPEFALAAVARATMEHTTSLGVRFDPVGRQVLERELVRVNTSFGEVVVKIGRLDKQVINVAPEYDSCRERALAAGVAVKQVYAAAVAAWSKRS